ncbi:uncharacterized protein LOC111409803 isoform X3 [Olea europaea var. sylvestris]|uniref:uncharacterized protein LOC111409803 isoform X3 n=1 Tax=Olea europaea var. sylvestris TaxID=158386 RepID=UPI000C1D00CF|nr:uncharacterized protein LOC111409803 isoform X3 [Olea europaea var. sylvestris]
MHRSWVRVLSARKTRPGLGLCSRIATIQTCFNDQIIRFSPNEERVHSNADREFKLKPGSVFSNLSIIRIGATQFSSKNGRCISTLHTRLYQKAGNFCTSSEQEMQEDLFEPAASFSSGGIKSEMEEFDIDTNDAGCAGDRKAKPMPRKSIDFTKIDIDKLPTVVIIGRPNVGKSALFNRLTRRREALVYNTPNDHVTRDIRDGVAKLGDLRFRILDSAGLEAEASSGSILGRTAAMTETVLASSQFALFLVDARDGLQPMDLDVGKWLRKHASGIKTLVVMNKAELLDDISGSLAAAAGEAYTLGFGDPIALSAETGLGMTELYEALRPLLEDYVLHILKGWLGRTKQDKGASSLSIMQSRKHLMRAHVVALVLDAEEIARARRSMKHAEVVIARRAVEEGRGLVVVVNKMDLLKGKQNSKIYERVIEAVPEEIQTVIPQVSGIPVVFVSALEGKGRIAVMREVVETYEKWCLRLPTARLNRWLRKVMSRHSWKDQAAQPKIKYFTQVKARPPTFVAFVSAKMQLSDTDLRFLTKSLKEDFNLGGIPVRIMQRTAPKNSDVKTIVNKNRPAAGRMSERVVSDKRSISVL